MNIIGHSKGGLVARHYAVDRAPFSGPFIGVTQVPSINRLILAQTPNTGALQAAVEEIFPVYRLNNLLPLWPWFRPNERAQFTLRGENHELSELNSRRLPAGVQYTILYGRAESTRFTLTGPIPRALFGTDDGDGVVPTFSMLGRIVDTNLVGLPGQTIRAFAGVPMNCVQIDGAHSNYLQQPGVMPELAFLLRGQRGTSCEP